MSTNENRNEQGAARPSALRQKGPKGAKKIFSVSLFLDGDWADGWEFGNDPVQIDVEPADEETLLTANVVASDEEDALAIVHKLWNGPIAQIRREAKEAAIEVEKQHAAERYAESVDELEETYSKWMESVDEEVAS